MTCNVRVGDSSAPHGPGRAGGMITLSGDFSEGRCDFPRPRVARPPALAPRRFDARATATPPRDWAAAGAARCSRSLRRGRAEAARGACVGGSAAERAGMAGQPPAAGPGGADLSRSVSAFELDRRARGEARRGLVIGLAARAAARRAPFEPRPVRRRSKLFIGNVVSAGSNAIVYVGKYNNEVRATPGRSPAVPCSRAGALRAAGALAPGAPGCALARQPRVAAAAPQPGCCAPERGEAWPPGALWL